MTEQCSEIGTILNVLASVENEQSRVFLKKSSNKNQHYLFSIIDDEVLETSSVLNVQLRGLFQRNVRDLVHQIFDKLDDNSSYFTSIGQATTTLKELEKPRKK